VLGFVLTAVMQNPLRSEPSAPRFPDPNERGAIEKFQLHQETLTNLRKRVDMLADDSLGPARRKARQRRHDLFRNCSLSSIAQVVPPAVLGLVPQHIPSPVYSQQRLCALKGPSQRHLWVDGSH
jgi:hypothetical protein